MIDDCLVGGTCVRFGLILRLQTGGFVSARIVCLVMVFLISCCFMILGLRRRIGGPSGLEF